MRPALFLLLLLFQHKLNTEILFKVRKSQRKEREGGGEGVNSALATLTMAIKSANDNGGNTVASNVGRKCCHYSATLIESNTRSDNSNTNNNKGDV